MCRKSCSQCYYPFMKVFSVVTNQTLPQLPTPVEEWKFDNPVTDLTDNLETTTLKSVENKVDTASAGEPKNETELE